MATKITITVEDDQVVIVPPPVDPVDPIEQPVVRQLPGCAFFRKYVVTTEQAAAGQLTFPEFKDIKVYTIGIVDNPQVNGYMNRHFGFNHNDTLGVLDLSTLDIQPGCLVFVAGEWK